MCPPIFKHKKDFLTIATLHDKASILYCSFMCPQMSRYRNLNSYSSYIEKVSLLCVFFYKSSNVQKKQTFSYSSCCTDKTSLLCVFFHVPSSVLIIQTYFQRKHTDQAFPVYDFICLFKLEA